MPTVLRPVGSSDAATNSLLRRPSLVRKHDDIEGRSSPTASKRVKVKFDDKVEVKDLQAWEKAPELVQEEVRRALQMHAIGEDSGYDEIKNIYTHGTKEEVECNLNTLKNYTTALLSNVAVLNKSCSSLVYAVLKSAWISQPDYYITLYVRLLANLISAQGSFLPDVLDMMVQNMVLCGSISFKSNMFGFADDASSQILEEYAVRISRVIAYRYSVSNTFCFTISATLDSISQPYSLLDFAQQFPSSRQFQTRAH